MNKFVVLCACSPAKPTGTGVEDILERAVEAVESVASVAGTIKEGETCVCVPTEPPYGHLSLTSPSNNPTSTSGHNPKTQTLSRCRLDFSDINSKALRKGIEIMELVLEAIETNRLVAIRVHEGRKSPHHVELQPPAPM